MARLSLCRAALLCALALALLVQGAAAARLGRLQRAAAAAAAANAAAAADDIDMGAGATAFVETATAEPALFHDSANGESFLRAPYLPATLNGPMYPRSGPQSGAAKGWLAKAAQPAWSALPFGPRTPSATYVLPFDHMREVNDEFSWNYNHQEPAVPPQFTFAAPIFIEQSSEQHAAAGAEAEAQVDAEAEAEVDAEAESEMEADAEAEAEAETEAETEAEAEQAPAAPCPAVAAAAPAAAAAPLQFGVVAPAATVFEVPFGVLATPAATAEVPFGVLAASAAAAPEAPFGVLAPPAPVVVAPVPFPAPAPVAPVVAPAPVVAAPIPVAAPPAAPQVLEGGFSHAEWDRLRQLMAAAAASASAGARPAVSLVEMEMEMDADAETEVDAEAEADAEAETEADAEVDAEVDAETDAEQAPAVAAPVAQPAAPAAAAPASVVQGGFSRAEWDRLRQLIAAAAASATPQAAAAAPAPAVMVAAIEVSDLASALDSDAELGEFDAVLAEQSASATATATVGALDGPPQLIPSDFWSSRGPSPSFGSYASPYYDLRHPTVHGSHVDARLALMQRAAAAAAMHPYAHAPLPVNHILHPLASAYAHGALPPFADQMEPYAHMAAMPPNAAHVGENEEMQDFTTAFVEGAVEDCVGCVFD